MLSLMIHADYEGNDHCRKKLHNTLTRDVHFFCDVTTFISPKKELYCLNNHNDIQCGVIEATSR